MTALPIAIIGAGPQGLAAAAHLTERGEDCIVLERGDSAGAAVSEWGHVRLFSAWPELIDPAAARILAATGWVAPEGGTPTGQEWVERYLRPLATALGERIHHRTLVTGISRVGRDKVVDSGRSATAFTIHVVDAHGAQRRLQARAVLDASGTWGQPNPAGADGLPAIGEREARDARDAISYRIPADVTPFAGRHTLVVGAGHSAAHAILRLAELARTAPGTRVTWALRRGTGASVLGASPDDELPERAALGLRAQRAVDEGRIELISGFRVAEIRPGAALTVLAEDGREIADVDHIIALTGFRPDTSILRELRIDLDPALEAVAGIAREIDPNIHSCGTVAATGARQLAQPEPGCYIIGAKSYGRAPTFLALTGYEQVRSVAAQLAGDHEAAARNELRLPDTGVCGGAGEYDGAGGGSCCAAPLPLLQIGR